VPQGYEPVVRAVQVPDPAAFTRSLFVQELEKAGVAVGAPADGPNPRLALAASVKSYPEGDRVAQLESLPLSSTVAMALKVSHNVVANTLVLDMGTTVGGTDMADGLAVERSALTSIGVDPAAVSLGDGEGGVRSDLISPRAVVDLLTAVSRSRNAAGFRRSLPILGVDGSLASSVATTSPARGRVWAKTGTTIDGDLLNGRGILIAKGLAGYADTAGGRRVAFAIYVNNLPVESVDEAVAIGDELAAMAAAIQQGL
jgi:D-alanyl-D-alanine carboxypeptidase/D-alanyl-D-alanine-endopeptidase (penicillin-binding protein 4)